MAGQLINIRDCKNILCHPPLSLKILLFLMSNKYGENFFLCKTCAKNSMWLSSSYGRKYSFLLFTFYTKKNLEKLRFFRFATVGKKVTIKFQVSRKIYIFHGVFYRNYGFKTVQTKKKVSIIVLAKQRLQRRFGVQKVSILRNIS